MLDTEPNQVARFHLGFMVQLSKYLGFYPHGIYSEHGFFDMQEGLFSQHRPTHVYYLEGTVARSLWILMQTPFGDLSSLDTDIIDNRRTLQALVTYYELHMTQGRNIQSHHILSDVLA